MTPLHKVVPLDGDFLAAWGEYDIGPLTRCEHHTRLGAENAQLRDRLAGEERMRFRRNRRKQHRRLEEPPSLPIL